MGRIYSCCSVAINPRCDVFTVRKALAMTSPSVATTSDDKTGLPFQLFRGLGFLVLGLMIVSCVYAVFIIVQNWSTISV